MPKIISEKFLNGEKKAIKRKNGPQPKLRAAYFVTYLSFLELITYSEEETTVLSRLRCTLHSLCQTEIITSINYEI